MHKYLISLIPSLLFCQLKVNELESNLSRANLGFNFQGGMVSEMNTTQFGLNRLKEDFFTFNLGYKDQLATPFLTYRQSRIQLNNEVKNLLYIRTSIPIPIRPRPFNTLDTWLINYGGFSVEKEPGSQDRSIIQFVGIGKNYIREFNKSILFSSLLSILPAVSVENNYAYGLLLEPRIILQSHTNFKINVSLNSNVLYWVDPKINQNGHFITNQIQFGIAFGL